MLYEEVVKDFARRTRRNLEAMDRLKGRDGEDVYEVTQLINSCLGLLVFPQQEYVASIPKTPIKDLEISGWPIPRIRPRYTQVADLNEMIRYLRNAVSHFNVRFLGDGEGNIDVLEVWNERPIRDDQGRIKRNKGGAVVQEVNWKATLTVQDLRALVIKFTDLLIGEHENQA